MIYWNSTYETYEYVHPDGYIEIFRDDMAAKRFADKHGVRFSDPNEGLATENAKLRQENIELERKLFRYGTAFIHYYEDDKGGKAWKR